MKFIILYFILFVPAILFTQSTDESNSRLYQAIDKYRTHLMDLPANDLIELKTNTQRWADLEKDEKTRLKMIAGAASSMECYKNPYLSAFKHWKLKYPESGLTASMYSIDMTTMQKYHELVFMLYHKILDYNYPFPINANESLKEEFKFYNPIPGEQIGIVGAGDGTFAVLAAIIYTDVFLYINELNPFFLTHIEQKLESIPFVNHENIKTVEGKAKKTNFPKQSMDKIILRDVFHHFEKKEPMLKSISKSLKKGGLLYLKEKKFPNIETPHTCPKLMREDVIKFQLHKNGFILIDEMELENVYIMKFKFEE